MTDELDAVLELIERIIRDCRGKSCIFRGTSKIHENISSSIWRNHQHVFEDPRSGLSPVDVERDAVARASRFLGHSAPRTEVITDLRHFGGDTNVIDFSRDFLVALFFACYGDYDKSGEVMALPTTDIEVLDDDIDLDKPPLFLQILNPARTQATAYRSNPQKSVFVYAPDGLIPKGLCILFEIKAHLKKPLLDYLRENHNICESTMFNDLVGHVSHEHVTTEAMRNYYEGEVLANKRQYAEAVKKYDESISIRPDIAQVHVSRCFANYHLKNIEGAKKDIERAVALEPRNPICLYSRGLFRSLLDDPAGAVQDLDNAIEIDPTISFFHSLRGVVKYVLDDLVGALQDQDNAIKLEKDNASFHNRRGVVLTSLREYTSARNAFDIAIELEPNMPSYHHSRGIVNEHLGYLEFAQKDFDRASMLDPDTYPKHDPQKNPNF